MFGTVANALLWIWTSVGAALELLFLILPVAFGWKSTIDAGLVAHALFLDAARDRLLLAAACVHRLLHALAAARAGGRLYSDRMGRVVFVLFLVLAMPIGIHHLFADPHIGAGFKFLHTVFTAGVVIPTLLTDIHA